MDRDRHLQLLTEQANAYREASAALEAARDTLAQRALAAMADGIGQADVLRATDHVWSREYLRQLARNDDRQQRDVPWQENERS